MPLIYSSFDSTKHTTIIRGRLEVWTKETWGEVYGFQVGGTQITGRKEDYTSGEFAGKADPKEDFAIADCKDPGAKAVLAFQSSIWKN